jgi:hypothetical protein
MADENNWYYAMGGQQQGPVPLDHLKHWLTTGQLQSTELVWREGMANWMPANQVPELRGFAPAMTGAAAAGFGHQPPQPQAGGHVNPVNYESPYAVQQDPRILAQVSQARTSMICGIIGIFCIGFILGLIAIIMASQAMSSMRKTGSEEGRGMAVAGMVLGILGLIGHCGWLSMRFHRF